MRRLVLAIALVGCGSNSMTADDQAPADGDGGGSGEPAELVGITAAHNRVRAMITSASGALTPLTWDDSLAATARQWAAQCKDTDHNGLEDHNDDRSVGHAYYVGENIYASSGTANGPGAVSAWAGEVANYHYDTNTCDDGQVCGHYTQIVWRTTQALGCALYNCSALQFSSTVVCDYGPGGNINNARPY